MKTRVLIGAILLAIAQGVMGQGSTNFIFRYRSPIINDSTRCDLSPLFAWWAAQLQAERPVTNSNSNPDSLSATAFTSTPRPMDPWLHVAGPIIRDDSQGWIVDATVESGPGKGDPMKILLIHPPRKEMDRFAQRLTLVNNPLPPPDYSAQEAAIKTQDNRAFIAGAIGDDDLENAYEMAANQASRELQDRKARDQTAAAERNDFLTALGDFPTNWQTYQVDLFAFNTGRQLNGLPIFDAGLSFAK
jgi:hypothetical protein